MHSELCSDLFETKFKESIMIEPHKTSIAEIAVISPAKLKRFLRRWEKDDNEIEEIIAAALLIALRCLNEYKAQSSVETWFYGICKNTARQHVASKVQRDKVFLNIDDYGDLESMQLISANAFSPEEETIKKEEVSILNNCISRLPVDQQQVFQEIYIDGNPYEQVAHNLNVPMGTLKSRINRMRMNLIEKMAK